MQHVDIVAAFIWEKNKFLICQRPANKARALLWEFVGGKVEKGETHQEALIRECQEELAITVEVGKLFYQNTHSYNDITINLFIYHAKIISGTITKLEHNDLQWISPNQIPQFTFCPADVEVLSIIQEKYKMKN